MDASGLPLATKFNSDAQLDWTEVLQPEHVAQRMSQKKSCVAAECMAFSWPLRETEPHQKKGTRLVSFMKQDPKAPQTPLKHLCSSIVVVFQQVLIAAISDSWWSETVIIEQTRNYSSWVVSTHLKIIEKY